MTTPLRIIGFLAALAAVFGVAVLAGRAVAPDVADDVASDDHAMGEEHGGAEDEHEEGHADQGGDHPTYRLELENDNLRPGNRELTFRILDDHGQPLRDFDVVHEKKLHLVVVGTPSLVDFQHVHPELGADGRWTTRVRVSPGVHHVYADATTDGENFVATARIDVRGTAGAPAPVPEPTVLERTGPYDVAMSHTDDGVTFTVSRDGRPVTDLQPYLGAYGHLVVIETDGFDYLHAHPLEGPSGPDISFGVAGGDGAHRMFLEFKHDGAVRRVAFTVPANSQGHGHEEDEGHEH